MSRFTNEPFQYGGESTPTLSALTEFDFHT